MAGFQKSVADVKRNPSMHSAGVTLVNGTDIRDFSINTKKFTGENGVVKKLHGIRLEWDKGPDGRPAMKEISGSEFDLDCDLCLLAPRLRTGQQRADVTKALPGRVQHWVRPGGREGGGERLGAAADGGKAHRSIIVRCATNFTDPPPAAFRFAERDARPPPELAYHSLRNERVKEEGRR